MLKLTIILLGKKLSIVISLSNTLALMINLLIFSLRVSVQFALGFYVTSLWSVSSLLACGAISITPSRDLCEEFLQDKKFTACDNRETSYHISTT